MLGAHRILMGPTSDLGPVDPQFLSADGSLAAGKAIIAAVEDAERRVQANPETYALHAALLSDVTALMVQQARDEIARSGAQVREALASHPERPIEDINGLAQVLHAPLIDETSSHRATISARDAIDFGLPVEEVDPGGPQWQAIWRIWTKYVALGPVRVYEGQTASQLLRAPFAIQ